MALKPLMLMRKKNLLSAIMGKYANLQNTVAKGVGHYYDVSGGGYRLQMNSGLVSEDGLTTIVIFSQNVFFTEATIPNDMKISNVTTAEAATITVANGSGTGQVEYTVTWLVVPVFGDALNIEYDGLGDYQDADNVPMEAQVLALVNNALQPPVLSGDFDLPNMEAGTFFNYDASIHHTGGITPTGWTLTGTPPTNADIDANGLITGQSVEEEIPPNSYGIKAIHSVGDSNILLDPTGISVVASAPHAPELTGVFNIPNATNGDTYIYDATVHVTSGNAPTSWALTGTPPTNMVIDNSGQISGTAVTEVIGADAFGIQASNSGGDSNILLDPDGVTVSATLQAPVASGTFDLANRTSGTAFDYDASQHFVTGGSVDTYALTGTPPTGASINTSTGLITGTSVEGSYSGYAVSGTNTQGTDTTNTDTLTVSASVGAMVLGVNTNSLTSADEPRMFNNVVRQAKEWTQEEGVGDYSQKYGVLTPTNPTDEFNLTISNASSNNILFPAGTYTLRFEGSGEVAVGSNVGSQNLQDWTAADTTFYMSGEDTLQIMFRGSSLTSATIVHADNLADFDAGNEWQSDYIAFLQELAPPVIRAMNLAKTNQNVQQIWTDRVLPTDIVFATGVPIEVLADLANQLAIDLWWCMPVRADANFMEQAGAIWKANLDAGILLYVEYTNEAWNSASGFAPATKWVTYLDSPETTDIACDDSSNTFTKVAHGFSNGDLLSCFVHKQQLWDGHSETSSTSSPGKINWKLTRGVIDTVINATADTFQLENKGETLDIFPDHKLMLVKNVTGKPEDQIDPNYTFQSEAMWDELEKNMTRSDMHYTLGSQSGTVSRTIARAGALVDQNRADSVAIATYFRGALWANQLNVGSGVVTPQYYCMESDKDADIYFSLYLASDSPTQDEIIAGTGAINHQKLILVGAKTVYTAGAQVTGLTSNITHSAKFVLVDEYGWKTTMSITFTPNGVDLITSYDTVVNQGDREINDIINKAARFKEHSNAIAQTIIGYEGGQDYGASVPSDVKAWLKDDYYLSNAVQQGVEAYINQIAQYAIPLYCQYKDISVSTFALTKDIASRNNDGRYRGYHSFNASVPIPSNIPIITSFSPSVFNEPVNPNVEVYDFSTQVSSDLPVNYFIVNGNSEGLFTLSSVGILALASGKSINWGAVNSYNITVKIDDRTNISQGYQQMLLGGNAIYADLVAESSMKNGGIIALDYDDVYLFTHDGSKAYPEGELLTYLPDIPSGETLTVRYVASNAINADSKKLEIDIRGDIDGSTTTLGSGWADVDTPLQSYTVVVSNNSANAYSSVILRYRYANITDINAQGQIGNLWFDAPWIGSTVVITLQPTNQTVTEPDAATFTIAATGIGTLSYQWRLNGINIPNELGTSYTTPATVEGQTGNYDCMVTDDNGSLSSDVATLTVNGGGGGGSVLTLDGTNYMTSDYGLEAGIGDTYTVTFNTSVQDESRYFWTDGAINMDISFASNNTLKVRTPYYSQVTIDGNVITRDVTDCTQFMDGADHILIATIGASQGRSMDFIGERSSLGSGFQGVLKNLVLDLTIGQGLIISWGIDSGNIDTEENTEATGELITFVNVDAGDWS